MIERGRKLVDQSKQYWWERAKSVFLLIGGVQKEQQTGGWSLTDLATTALNGRQEHYHFSVANPAVLPG